MDSEKIYDHHDSQRDEERWQRAEYDKIREGVCFQQARVVVVEGDVVGNVVVLKAPNRNWDCNTWKMTTTINAGKCGLFFLFLTLKIKQMQ